MYYFFIRDEYKALIRKRNDLCGQLQYLGNYSPSIPELDGVSYTLWLKRKARISTKIGYYNSLLKNAKVYGNQIISTVPDQSRLRIGLGSKIVLQMNNILTPFIIGGYLTYKRRLSYASKLGSILLGAKKGSSFNVSNGDVVCKVSVISIT